MKIKGYTNIDIRDLRSIDEHNMKSVKNRKLTEERMSSQAKTAKPKFIAFSGRKI